MPLPISVLRAERELRVQRRRTRCRQRVENMPAGQYCNGSQCQCAQHIDPGIQGPLRIGRIGDPFKRYRKPRDLAQPVESGPDRGSLQTSGAPASPGASMRIPSRVTARASGGKVRTASASALRPLFTGASPVSTRARNPATSARFTSCSVISRSGWNIQLKRQRRVCSCCKVVQRDSGLRAYHHAPHRRGRRQHAGQLPVRMCQILERNGRHQDRRCEIATEQVDRLPYRQDRPTRPGKPAWAVEQRFSLQATPSRDRCAHLLTNLPGRQARLSSWSQTIARETP